MRFIADRGDRAARAERNANDLIGAAAKRVGCIGDLAGRSGRLHLPLRERRKLRLVENDQIGQREQRGIDVDRRRRVEDGSRAARPPSREKGRDRRCRNLELAEQHVVPGYARPLQCPAR